MKWIALTSFTGTEIRLLSEQLGYGPDLIITNNIHSSIILKADNFAILPDKPTPVDYRGVFRTVGTADEVLITMHGWNRIIPPSICEDYYVLNVHPGDIVVHPELKGFNPQQKAVELGLKYTGVVIHRASAEVDSGEIIMLRGGVNIEHLTVEEVTDLLRFVSIDLWLTAIPTFKRFETISAYKQW